MKNLFNIKIYLFIFALLASTQVANSQIIDSSFYQWVVYEINADDIEEKQCYIVSHPISSNSDHGSRKTPYIMITRFEKDRVEEISVYDGFEFKLNSQVFLLIDDHQFKLFAKKDIAWAGSKAEDVKIIQTILNSAVIRVRADSAVGTYAVDEYSLEGVTRAYARMREICR